MNKEYVCHGCTAVMATNEGYPWWSAMRTTKRRKFCDQVARLLPPTARPRTRKQQLQRKTQTNSRTRKKNTCRSFTHLSSQQAALLRIMWQAKQNIMRTRNSTFLIELLFLQSCALTRSLQLRFYPRCLCY